MLRIRLTRRGAKKNPFYRVVVKERRSKRDGKYLENLGTYNPMTDPPEVKLDHERIQYWIGQGAQPTETVASLIKNNPEMTPEEREKWEAERKARIEAKKAEEEKARAEKAQAAKEAAEKKAAEAAAAAAADAESAVEAAEGEEAGEAEVKAEAPAEESPAAEAPAAEAEEAPAEAAAEEAPAEEAAAEEPKAEADTEAEAAKSE